MASSSRAGWTAVNAQEIPSAQPEHQLERRSDSSKASRRAARHQGGVLRGLDPSNVLATPRTQATIEVDGVEATQHITRQSRQGRSSANYNMKYHPMDEVTRPKRAARLSRTLSPAGVKTDEEILAASAVESDGETTTTEEDGEATSSTLRVPNPLATRKSSRPSTQRNVNYSSKHHPQDFAIPGYQHKSKQLKQIQKSQRSRKTTKEPRPSTPTPSSGGPEIADSEEDGEEVASAPPRKKVRNLKNERPRKNEKQKADDRCDQPKTRKRTRTVPPPSGQTASDPMHIGSGDEDNGSLGAVQQAESPHLDDQIKTKGFAESEDNAICAGALQGSLNPNQRTASPPNYDFGRHATQRSLDEDDRLLENYRIQMSNFDFLPNATQHVVTHHKSIHRASSNSRTLLPDDETSSRTLSGAAVAPQVESELIQSGTSSEFEEPIAITQSRDDRQHDEYEGPSVSQYERSDEFDHFTPPMFGSRQGTPRYQWAVGEGEERPDDLRQTDVDLANADFDARAGSALVSYDGGSEDLADESDYLDSRRAGGSRSQFSRQSGDVGNLLRHVEM